MPDFRLTESETVSLVKHLTRDMQAPSRLLTPVMPIPIAERRAYLDAGKRLMSKDYFDCTGCHQLGDKKPDKPVNEWAPDLTMAARRLRPEWIVRWIQDPQKILKGTRMPTIFEDKDSGPEDILGGDEAKQIRALTEYILSLGGVEEGGPSLVSFEKREPGAPEAAAKRPSIYELAEKRYPDASRARGARLMNELNCAECHDVGDRHEKLETNPPLAHEGSRVKKSWLTEFLKKPTRIRPSGYTAGGSSRMPGFGKILIIIPPISKIFSRPAGKFTRKRGG